ncbi:unnamed protein product [Caenorhabditis angaria]|uniref:Uncharacterized protein n=1 Tax=Caenorhabditis angaria TaxID=860376 RepID=A0A9P1IXT8_9PELO|nr:unnamed protein product [Caenorhabditis angaria]
MDVHVFLIKPFMFFPTTAVAFYGWFEEFGVSYKVQAYLLQVHYVWIALSILFLFKDRYDCIVHQNPNRKYKTIYYFANLSFCCLVIIPPYVEKIDEDLEKSKIISQHPLMPPRFFASQTHIVTTQIALAVETRKMQLRTEISLILQTLIPIVALGVPVIFNSVLMFLGIYVQAVNIFTLIVLLSHGLTSTLCIIYNYQPYREYTKNLICCHKNQIHVNSIPHSL